MRDANIEVGKIYTDGKGRYRRITGVGEQFRVRPDTKSEDCFEYELMVRDAEQDMLVLKLRNGVPVPRGRATRVTLAHWAVREASL